jgi:hypothetical protein
MKVPESEPTQDHAVGLVKYLGRVQKKRIKHRSINGDDEIKDGR